MPITAERFVGTHQGDWQRLSELVDKAQRSRLSSLTDEELHELGLLYRRASSDLARAQTRYATTKAGQELVRSLNDLVLRAHTQVYSAPPPQPARALHFLLYGFPATFRRHWRAISFSALLLFGSGLVAYLAVLVNPDLAPLFVPEWFIEGVKQRAQQNSSGQSASGDLDMLLFSPVLSSFIMTNNIYVAMRAVALGVTLGIGTVKELLVNGLLLGGLSGVATNERVDLLYWSLILPHGIIELMAIAIAGGAGFVLARALYAPGDLPRRDAIKIAGGEAARLLAGVVLLLIIAGLIEGFITPRPLPPVLKIAFALLTAIALAVYLSLRPRRGREGLKR